MNVAYRGSCGSRQH